MANTRKRLLAASATAALVVSLAACGGGSSDDDDSSNPTKATKGGTLTYLLASPMGHTDPHRVYVGRDISNLSRTVYRQLVTFPTATDIETANTPVADLATDTGTSSDDGKVWKFTVKDGVTWQDGKDITCEDFKYGASRAFANDVITGGPNYLLSYLDIPSDADGAPVYKGPYTDKGQADFDKAVTCDGKTITYNFKKAWPDFPLAIAALHMLDPYRADLDKGEGSNFEIFSNGPYMLEGKWDENKGGTLVRNPEYDASTDSPENRQANPEKIIFDIGKTPETINDLLIQDNAEVQAAVTGTRVLPQYIAQASALKDRYQNVESPYVDYLVPNTKRLSLEVREALAVATNVEAWITAGGGEKFYKKADSIVNPVVPGYQPVEQFKDLGAGDPDAAKKILEDAGVKLPYKLKFTYDGASETADKQAAALKETWDKSGFETTLNPLTDAYYPTIQDPNADSDVTWAGWGADWPSALTVTAPLFDSRINLTPSSNNQDYGNYKSDEFNKLVDEAQAAGTLEEQTKALQAADAVLGKDYAYVPLEISLFNWVHGSKVNFATTPASNGFADLGLISVK
ncbi:ABC transporter substrate-binding protein [Nocardioides sp. WS12]|uniref:ABC transporter substrate-binding protein n=1 Tax=Nocardioides sp. WS12 TaxID=2486272 RepID=UPI0015FB2760|nr:ABC transporter substrate-binding protein [Nocardioides sp. WS12]